MLVESLVGSMPSLTQLMYVGGLAMFVGRWASFLSGQDYGKPAADLAWAVKVPPGSVAPANQALHPTQLYHSLHGLLLFGILWFALLERYADAVRTRTRGHR